MLGIKIATSDLNLPEFVHNLYKGLFSVSFGVNKND